MKGLPACTNPSYQEPATSSRLGNWLTCFLQDKRDLPFAYLLLKLSATVLPLAVALLVPALAGWAVLAAFLYLSLLRYKGPFGLMLHCASHCLLFKKRYGWLKHYISRGIGPLFGQTPETYCVHHLGMHHAENDTAEDKSLTVFYQRDLVWDFLHYFGDFFLLAGGRRWGYLTRRNWLALRRCRLRGKRAHLVVAVGLSWANWPAAVAVSAVPFVLARFIMMLGNWAQHAFIAPARSGNCYTNSIACLHTLYNH